MFNDFTNRSMDFMPGTLQNKIKFRIPRNPRFATFPRTYSIVGQTEQNGTISLQIETKKSEWDGTRPLLRDGAERERHNWDKTRWMQKCSSVNTSTAASAICHGMGRVLATGSWHLRWMPTPRRPTVFTTINEVVVFNYLRCHATDPRKKWVVCLRDSSKFSLTNIILFRF